MSEGKNISTASRIGWGPFQIGGPWYSLLVLCVLAQTITVVLTWRLWLVREYPINLPLLDGPWISFGAPVLLSLIYVLIDPRRGAVIHIVVLAIACFADQYRIQPQFLSISVLIFGCSTTQRQNYCRWYLIAMWFWAGTHKIFSPEWPMIAWNILERSQFDADNFYQFFLLGSCDCRNHFGHCSGASAPSGGDSLRRAPRRNRAIYDAFVFRF